MPWQSKLSIGLIILLSSCQQSDRQVALKSSTAVPLGKEYIIPVGTVGLVSIRSENSANYELKVIFPTIPTEMIYPLPNGTAVDGWSATCRSTC